MNYIFRSAAAALLLTAVFSISANAQFVVEPPVVEPPVVEPPTPVCNECDGKIDNIIFRFDGGTFSFVEVESRRGRQFQSLYAGYLNTGRQFSVSGSTNYLDRKGTLGATIYIRIDGGDRLPLHTSCSQPIGPGTQVGDLIVISATSRNGGLTCPVGDVPPLFD